MNTKQFLAAIEAASARDRDKLARAFNYALNDHFRRLDLRMTQLDDTIASTATKVATLTTKVDAALAALAASVASQTPVTQAELDAITAIGTAADGESAKVDAALAPAAGAETPEGDGGPGEEPPPTN